MIFSCQLFRQINLTYFLLSLPWHAGCRDWRDFRFVQQSSRGSFIERCGKCHGRTTGAFLLTLAWRLSEPLCDQNSLFCTVVTENNLPIRICHDCRARNNVLHRLRKIDIVEGSETADGDVTFQLCPLNHWGQLTRIEKYQIPRRFLFGKISNNTGNPPGFRIPQECDFVIEISVRGKQIK